MNTSLIPFQLSKLDRLNIKPPPAALFEELMGYHGGRRWVGFYYQHGCLFHCAGEGTGAGNWQPWLIWHWSLGHQVLSRYSFGYDDSAAQHMLVLDRMSRTLYAGKLEVAGEVLRQQLSAAERSPGGPVTREELERLREENRRRLMHLPPVEYREYRETLDCGLDKLEAWLRERQGGCADLSMY